MKKYFYAATMMALLAMTSCEKKDNTTPAGNTGGTNNSNAAVSFKLDGTQIDADSANAVLYTFMVPPYGRKIDIFAFKGGTQVFEGHIDPKTGTQVMGDSTSTALMTYQTATEGYYSVSGSCNFTECDTINGKLTGTFNFVGEPLGGGTSKNISAGSIKLTQIRKH